MEADLEFIQAGLQRLQTLPIEQVHEVSLSFKRYRYRLNPPLTEDAVQRFEAEHGINLPPEYRAFLIRLGNGGAGPAYGVFKLGEVELGWESEPFEDCVGFVGDLSKPFPHTDVWNDRSDEAIYWGPIDGAIPICDVGCGSSLWLVATGPEAGHVWCDQRSDCEGLGPMERNGTRLTFFQWYREWLEKELARHQDVNPPPPNSDAATESS